MGSSHINRHDESYLQPQSNSVFVLPAYQLVHLVNLTFASDSGPIWASNKFSSSNWVRVGFALKRYGLMATLVTRMALDNFLYKCVFLRSTKHICLNCLNDRVMEENEDEKTRMIVQIDQIVFVSYPVTR